MRKRIGGLMSISLIGKKLGMTEIFNERGETVSVTAIEVGPCKVIQIKNTAKDGVNAVQLGFDLQKEKQATKPLQGHFKRAGVAPCKILREFTIPSTDIDKFSVGQEFTVDLLNNCKKIDVIATSKGRGFAGVVKRWNFNGSPASHGTHEYFRHAGAIGNRSTPGHIYKGKKMPGHMGHRHMTVQNLDVVGIKADQNVLLVRGAVPGPMNGYVVVRKAIKVKG